jgi:hypothetical protein
VREMPTGYCHMYLNSKYTKMLTSYGEILHNIQ